MSLPAISAKVAIKALGKAGFIFIRQSGSHIVLQKKIVHSTVTLVVPNHSELARGTLRAIIRKAGMTVDEFASLL